MRATNVFYYLTYEGNVDLESMSDPVMKEVGSAVGHQSFQRTVVKQQLCDMSDFTLNVFSALTSSSSLVTSFGCITHRATTSHYSGGIQHMLVENGTYLGQFLIGISSDASNPNL